MVPTGTGPEDHLAMTELKCGWHVTFHHLEQVAIPPDIVAFPIEILAGRFALLFKELFLLLANPGELGDCEDPYCIEAQSHRGGYRDPACRRVYAEVDVLNVFVDDGHGKISKSDLRLHQYSG
jgi:hypothetical protein